MDQQRESADIALWLGSARERAVSAAWQAAVSCWHVIVFLSSTLPTLFDWTQRHRAFALPAEVTYLDAASRGPLLRAVQQVAHQAVDAMAAPWRLPFDAWLQQIEQLRVLAAALFDGDADALAMVPSAAHGLATVARNLPLDRRDAVLVLEGQFPPMC